MSKKMNITIENKLVLEERDMSVYHQATRSAHMISHDSSVTLPLEPAAAEDYLYISIIGGPGHLKRVNIVDMPSWVDFEFLTEGKVGVSHSNNRTLVKIAPGLPGWQLKLKRSVFHYKGGTDRVIICEDLQENP
jgi:hypothetical protein